MIKNNEYYELLGIQSNSTKDEIKKAYKKKALQEHPDRGGDAEKFNKISIAYKTLIDDNKRIAYDTFGENKTDDVNNFMNLFRTGFNVFNDFTNFVSKPPPVCIDHYVTLESVCKRSVIKLKYKRDIVCTCITTNGFKKCGSCNGSGVQLISKNLGNNVFQKHSLVCSTCKGSKITKLKTECVECDNGIINSPTILQLYLTPDIYDGYNYTIKGEGPQQVNKLASDVVIIVKYKDHHLFKIKNNNLLCNLSISLKDALLGFNRIIEHPSGEILNLDTTGSVINIDSKTVFKDKGMCSTSDLIFSYTVIFPTTLSKEQLNILEL